MSDSNKKISIIDLIEYYEPGPVLRERTPDLNRVSFHPGDGEHYNGDDATSAGKSITSSTRRRWLSKKALGLTGVPIHGTPGNIGAFRQRDEYSEEDEEAQFTTGFGGPSELDNFLEKEDKSPTNISRKLNTAKKLKTLGDLDKMSFQKSELLKLAKALRFRGHNNFADSITKLAEGERTEDELNASGGVYDALFGLAGIWEVFDRDVMNKWRKEKYYIGGQSPAQHYPKPTKEFIEATYNALIEYWNKQDLQAGGGGQPNDDDIQRNKTFLNAAKGGKIDYEGFITSMWDDGKGGYAASGTGGYSLLNAFESREEFDAAVTGEVKNFMLAWHAVTDYSNTYYPSSEGETAATSEGGEAATSQGETTERPITTQQRTPKGVQRKINEVFAGPLLPRVKDNYLVDAEGNQMTDAGGNPVAIPIDDDGAFGPQTTAAFNAATNNSYGPYRWPITVDAAYNMLDSITADTPADTAPAEGEPAGEEAPGDTGAGEVDAEEEKEAVLRGNRLNVVANLDEWYIAPSDDGRTLVAIRKRDGQLAAMTNQEFDVVRKDEGGYTLTQSDDGQRIWTDIENRGESNQVLFQSGDDYLSTKEQKRLINVIEEAGLEDNVVKTYKDVIVGQRRSERGGFLNLKGVKRKGRRRETGARERLRRGGE